MRRVVNSRETLRRLFAFAAEDGRILAIAAIASATVSVCQLSLTWLVKEWVEGPVLGADTQPADSLLVRATLVSALAMAAIFASRYALAAASQRFVERLRNAANDALLAASPSIVGRTTSGEWLSRIFNDVNVLSGFIAVVMRRLVTESLVLAGAVVLMFVLNWRVALAAMLTVPVAAVFFMTIGRLIRRWSSATQEAAADLTSTIAGQLRGFTTVKTHQAEPLFRLRMRGQNAAVRKRALRGELWSAALISVVFLVVGAAFLAILYSSTQSLRLSGAAQAATLAFVLYAAQAVEPARRLSEVQGLLQQSLAAAARVFAVLDLEPERDAGIAAFPDDASIRFDDVAFSYREGEPVLRGATFAVGDREILGIAGPTGCGKSTLTRFLVRFCEPRVGRVCIGTTLTDVRSIPLLALRSAVCLVEQEPFLFDGPLIDNIRLGNPRASLGQVEQAVRMTRLDALVAALPQGLASPLSEAGRDLSGGERQRIALARAIVRDPRILVLDEATSSIDGETETAIFAAMEPWLRQRTVIVIAHRLSTLLRVSRVVVIDEGRVAEEGEPSRLLTDGTAFRSLFAGQLTEASGLTA